MFAGDDIEEYTIEWYIILDNLIIFTIIIYFILFLYYMIQL